MAIVRSGKPKNIAIHHSAVNPPAKNLAELKTRASAHNNYHRSKSEGWNNTTSGEYGYKWIRYHYMIAQDGSVLQVQDDKYVLFHSGDGSKGEFNYWGIAIMFEGNYEIAQPTDAMMRSAVELIRRLEKKYGIDPKVRGHREISATTACPGKNLGTSKSGWIKNLIANINNKDYPPKPPAPPEPPQDNECQKQVDRLIAEINDLKSQLGDLQTIFDEDVAKLEDQITIVKLANVRLQKDKLKIEEELSIYKNQRFAWLIEWLEKIVPKKND
jgi:hypothetical protein